MSFPTLTFEAAFGSMPTDTPRQYLFLPGTSGNYASTPDAGSLDITSDIDLRAVIAVGEDASTQTMALIVKAAPGQFSYSFRWFRSTIRLALSDDGSVVGVAGSDTFSYTPGGQIGVRATWRESDQRVQFFVGDADDAPTDWPQVGSDETLGFLTGTTIHPGTANLRVGQGETVDEFDGRFLWGEVRDGLDGTVVADPDFTDTVEWSPGDTSGSDAAGNTWTINQSGDPEAAIVDPWTDLSDRLRVAPGINWGYGRQNELDRMEAGTGTVWVDNLDRALDPTNEASVLFPEVRPMVRVRLRATHDTTTYDVLEGFVEAWPQQWPGFVDAVVSLSIVDGFKLLSMARTSAAYSQESSGTRVGNLLDAADWPADKRDLNVGQSDVQAYSASDRIVLNAIRDTAATESGTFFIDPSGDAVFRDRLARITASSQATFGDSGAELRYAGLVPSYDDSNIWNDIPVKPEGLTVQRAQDTTSQDRYGHRQLPEFGALITTEAEALDAANWALRRLKDARQRVDSLTVHGHRNDDLLTQVLTRKVGDRITVKRRPPGGGDPMTLDVFIEKVNHQVGEKTWTTTWQLSPASSETVWLIGTVGFSEIGETTFAGY